MSENRYNGWTNWESFVFTLWVRNDETVSNKIRALAKSSKDIIELANKIENMTWNMQKESLTSKAGFFADVTNKAIQAVNYTDIAEDYINNLDNN